MRSKIPLIILLILLLVGYFYLPDQIVNPIKSIAGYAASPFEKAASVLSSKSRDFFRGIAEIRNLRDENNDLKQQIADLMDKNSQLMEVKNENGLLKKEIEVNTAGNNFNLLEAVIIGREPASFLQSFTVDQGTDSGVKVGQAVIYQGVLVGKVTAAYKTTSEITLILSSHSIIQAQLQENRTLGIVKGGLQGLYLDNIPLDVPFKSGEMVITSGLGGDLPKGIIIGKVDKLTTPKSEIFQTFSLITPLDFQRLETVFVVR